MAKLPVVVNPLASKAILFLCVAALTHPCFSSETSNTSDPVWRMVVGSNTARSYTSYEEPLLSITGDSSVQLHSLLESVCDLVSVYELISKVNSSSDLHILLTQTVIDSCNWLNHLISENAYTTASAVLIGLPDTCSAQSTPRLHRYCFQMKVREEDQLRRLVQNDIYDGLSTYYPSCVANDETSCEWLQSSPAIPDDTRERIQQPTNLNCSE